MSILIKGMEMPTTCKDCPCFYPEYNECNAIVGRWVDGKGTPPSDCPLVPIPPHGRLIDADAVTDAAMEDILGWEDAGCDRSDYRAFLDNYIEDAPTIIPAEEGE